MCLLWLGSTGRGHPGHSVARILHPVTGHIRGTMRAVRTIARHHQRTSVAAIVSAVVVLALVAGGCAGPTWVAQVTSTDSRGLCARNLDSGEVQCWMYTPEFPSETAYRTGECIAMSQAYRYSGPPHTRRVACPSAATTSSAPPPTGP